MNGAHLVARLAGAAVASIAAIVLSTVTAQAAPARIAAAKPISKVLGVRLPGAKAGVCALPAPNLVVTPAPVSFPVTLRETVSAPVPIAIQNTGTGTLVVSAITVSDPPCDCSVSFNVVDTNGCVGAAIPPGGSCTVDATFYAYGGTGQTWSGTIDIASNDPSAPISSWPVEGTIGASQLTVSASTLDFGSTAAVPPAPVSLPLGVANAGNLPLTLSGVSIFGSGFTAVPGANCAPYGTSFPLTLPVGAACDLAVTFTPLSIGLYTNVSLYVNFTDGSNNDSEWVRLTGAGIG
ncbi:MAG: choice-of-anchor D domain-containing protein, partial [Burkholderiales bacterium]|nr:choice-of-anchor D domain-containing protein [Burkholderiales bacterium]